jgi:hypothetical protein
MGQRYGVQSDIREQVGQHYRKCGDIIEHFFKHFQESRSYAGKMSEGVFLATWGGTVHIRENEKKSRQARGNKETSY